MQLIRVNLLTIHPIAYEQLAIKHCLKYTKAASKADINQSTK